MKPFSDAPPSQTTPTTQAEPTATPTNTEALPPKPNGKAKVSEIAADCGNNKKKSTTWDHFEKRQKTHFSPYIFTRFPLWSLTFFPPILVPILENASRFSP